MTDAAPSSADPPLRAPLNLPTENAHRSALSPTRRARPAHPRHLCLPDRHGGPRSFHPRRTPNGVIPGSPRRTRIPSSSRTPLTHQATT